MAWEGISSWGIALGSESHPYSLGKKRRCPQPWPAHILATASSWPSDAAPIFCLLPLRELCLGKCHVIRGQQGLRAQVGRSSLHGGGAGVSLKPGPAAEMVRRVWRTRMKEVGGGEHTLMQSQYLWVLGALHSGPSSPIFAGVTLGQSSQLWPGFLTYKTVREEL